MLTRTAGESDLAILPDDVMALWTGTDRFACDAGCWRAQWRGDDDT